jgi:hypothetical protein
VMWEAKFHFRNELVVDDNVLEQMFRLNVLGN